MTHSPWSLLSNKHFLPLFINQCCNAFIILLVYIMLQGVGSSRWLEALAIGVFVIPFVTVSALTGQMIDKFAKAITARYASIFQLVTVVLATIGLAMHSSIVLLIALFLLGIHAAFFSPLKYALLPEQLNSADLLSGNAFIQAAIFLFAVLGAMTGSELLSLDSGVFLLTFLALAVSITALISSLFIPNTQPNQPALKISFHLVDQTKHLLPNITTEKALFTTVTGISWFWLICSSLLTLLPNFTQQVLTTDYPLTKLFLGTFALGIAAGAGFYLHILKSQAPAKFIPLAMVVIGILMIDLFFINPIATIPTSLFTQIHATAVMLLMGIACGIYVVPLYMMLETVAVAEKRARVIATNNVINAVSVIIVALIVSLLLILHIGSTAIFLLIGVMSLLMASYLCRLLPDAILKVGVCWFFKKFYNTKVVGLENYFQSSPRAMLIANNVSYLDVLLISAFLPDKMIFATHSLAVKKWWKKPFLALVDVFIIDSNNPMVLKSLVEKIRSGQRCLIFPQSRLNITGSLMKIYEGPGMIADKAEADILPVIIDGAQHTTFSRLKEKVRTYWFPPITITILPPRKIDIKRNIKGRQRRQLISNRIYELITDLSFETSDYQKTLYQSLIDACKVHGGGYKIVEDVERKPLSYRQFLGRTFIIGRYIAKHSHPNEFIGILLPNTTATLVCFFATYTFNRLPAMLNFSAGPKNILSACQTAQIRTVLTSQKFIEVANLSAVVEKLITNNINVVYLEEVRKEITLINKFTGLFMGYFPEYFYHKYNAQVTATDPAVILFTSGSEGAPKGVILSHKNIQANRLQIAARVDFTTADIAFNILPMFHSFGLTAATILPILSGVKIFLYPSPLHYRIVPELIYDTNATMMFGTDTFLSGYARYARPYDFYSIRYAFVGAEKLKDETRRLWSEKYGVRIFEGYGVTETAPVLSSNTPMQNKVGTVGKFLPQITYRLEPIEGIPDAGRLYVSGPNVMIGYMLASQPGKLIPPVEGWHDTGDIVSIDDEGYITIRGRAKRFAKIGGEMVSLLAVEEWINKLWPDFHNVAISVADPKKGEQIILATENSNATREALIAYFKEQGISEIHLPKKILFIEHMHILGTGKVDYVSVKEWVEEQLGGKDIE